MNNQFTNCLLCNSDNLVELKKYKKDHLYKCKKCSFVFSKQIPTEQELADTYAKYLRIDKVSSITVERFKELMQLFDKYKQNNKIIDIGAGEGHFIEFAKNSGWEAYATEYELRAVELCNAKGVITNQGKLNPMNYKAEMFDIIFSSEVIEHINNPVEEIQNFYKILRKGGIVYVTTPNINSLTHKYLGSKWNIFHYPEHISYYTPKTLEKLFVQNGFKKIKVTTTGISPNRFLTSLNNSKSDFSDEELRLKTETKFIWKIIKKVANTVLNLTGTGDAMKGIFVKI